eukprot:TRINITY_DN21189_c0_g1_i1.p1 TRINITY_DN21189_c0_g1~~TRINITY_DN21189_c0_g1_i1.p1  ORF type:complete len:487 (+),score=88.80 TRINITY_DN21189_c0_g1_i1:57-1517(+)
MDGIDMSVFNTAAFTIRSGPRAHPVAPAPAAREESSSPAPAAVCPVQPWARAEPAAPRPAPAAATPPTAEAGVKVVPATVVRPAGLSVTTQSLDIPLTTTAAAAQARGASEEKAKASEAAKGWVLREASADGRRMAPVAPTRGRSSSAQRRPGRTVTPALRRPRSNSAPKRQAPLPAPVPASPKRREASFEDEMVRSATASCPPEPEGAARGSSEASDGGAVFSPAYRQVACGENSVAEPAPLAGVALEGLRGFRTLGAFDVCSEERSDRSISVGRAASSTEDRSGSRSTSTSANSAACPLRSASIGASTHHAARPAVRSELTLKLREQGWVAPKPIRAGGPPLTARVVTDDLLAQGSCEGTQCSERVSTVGVVKRLFPNPKAVERRRQELEYLHVPEPYAAPRTRSTGPIVKRLSRPLNRRVPGYAGHDQSAEHTFKPKLCTHDGTGLGRVMGPVWERLTKEKAKAAAEVPAPPASGRRQKDVLR